MISPGNLRLARLPIAQGIGLAAAVEYLEGLGMEAVQAHAHLLVSYAMEQLRQAPDIELYGPEAEARGGVVSFNIKDLHPHDVASILDQCGVAIRAGHHCAMPLMQCPRYQWHVPCELLCLQYCR